MAAATELANAKRDWRGAFRAGERAARRSQRHGAGVPRHGGAERRHVGTQLSPPAVHRPRVAASPMPRIELIEKLTDKAWLAQFAPRNGRRGPIARSWSGPASPPTALPTSATRSIGEARGSSILTRGSAGASATLHDIWHVLTGYAAEDPLGELCLVAFSYAQTIRPGLGLHRALIGALKGPSRAARHRGRTRGVGRLPTRPQGALAAQ